MTKTAFDPVLLPQLKAAYAKAMREGCCTFTLDGPKHNTQHEFVTGFAKYLIEYLEMEKKK